MSRQDWNDRVWFLQLVVAFTWAAVIVGLWLAWTSATLGTLPPGNGGSVLVAATFTSGCCGLSWVVGLVPIVLCFALLRRPL